MQGGSCEQGSAVGPIARASSLVGRPFAAVSLCGGWLMVPPSGCVLSVDVVHSPDGNVRSAEIGKLLGDSSQLAVVRPGTPTPAVAESLA